MPGTNYSVALPNADFALNCTQQEAVRTASHEIPTKIENSSGCLLEEGRFSIGKGLSICFSADDKILERVLFSGKGL